MSIRVIHKFVFRAVVRSFVRWCPAASELITLSLLEGVLAEHYKVERVRSLSKLTTCSYIVISCNEFALSTRTSFCALALHRRVSVCVCCAHSQCTCTWRLFWGLRWFAVVLLH